MYNGLLAAHVPPSNKSIGLKYFVEVIVRLLQSIVSFGCRISHPTHYTISIIYHPDKHHTESTLHGPQLKQLLNVDYLEFIFDS